MMMMLRSFSLFLCCILLAEVTCFSPTPYGASYKCTVFPSLSSSSTTPSSTSTDNLHHNSKYISTTRLSANSQVNDLENIKVDYDALFKYHAAILIQMSLVSFLFWSLDWILSDLNVPYWAIIPLFYGLSLKSRVLNPLNNARPTVASGDGAVKGFQDRILPSWTPPGIVFPLVWILIMSPLRAVASALVWEANGHVLCNPALLALSFHLCVGDVWNTVNNAEQRFGGSVTGVLCVTATAVWAAVQYYEVTPLAGKLLGLTLVWLSIASSLVTATWKLNAPQDPLYPVQQEGVTTQFQWRWLERNKK